MHSDLYSSHVGFSVEYIYTTKIARLQQMKTHYIGSHYMDKIDMHESPLIFAIFRLFQKLYLEFKRL